MLFKKFDEKTGILSIKARGNIDFWELLDLYKTIETNNEYPRKLKIIIDTLKSKFDFPVKYNEDISKAINTVAKKYDIIKEAVVVDKYYETSVALMFDDKFVYDNLSFKIFTDMKAAQKWLNF